MPPRSRSGVELAALDAARPAVPPPRRRRWPAVGRKSVEDVRWQVLLGWRLRERRIRAGLNSKRAARQIGIPPRALSEVEHGIRGVLATELPRFGDVYRIPPSALHELLAPPTAEEWQSVLRVRVPDRRFTAPPTALIRRAPPGPEPTEAPPSLTAGRRPGRSRPGR